MDNISVLIIDDDAYIRQSIERAVQLDPELTLAGSTDNGIDGLCIAEEKKPDIILLDMVMPKKDGFTVLKNFQNLHMGDHITKIIVISSMVDSYVVQKSKSMGAFHCVAKPFELESLIENIKDIYSYKEAPIADSTAFSKPVSIERHVVKTLEELQLPSNVKGYSYILLILTEMIKGRSHMCALTKELYPIVVEKYGDTLPSIERALRTAIKRAWKCNHFNNSKLFETFTEKPPSNGQFLSAVSNYISLDVYV